MKTKRFFGLNKGNLVELFKMPAGEAAYMLVAVTFLLSCAVVDGVLQKLKIKKGPT